MWWCCVQGAVNATLDTLADMEPLDNLQTLLQMTTDGVCDIICQLVRGAPLQPPILLPVAEMLCGEGYCT